MALVELREFISLRNSFQATDNIAEALLQGYLLLLSLKKIKAKNIQNFVNEIQEYFGFDLEKDDDWKDVKIHLPEINAKIPVKKILDRSECYKKWDPGVDGHKTMYSIVEKNTKSLFELCSIHYDFLALHPI